MVRYGQYLFLFLALMVVFSSCKKKRVARQLKEQFQVERLAVGEVDKRPPLPELFFKRCRINVEECEGKWYFMDDESSALFTWDLSDDGEELSLFNQSSGIGQAAADMNKFSGTYEVEAFKGDELIISSRETTGFPGELVRIEMREVHK